MHTLAKSVLVGLTILTGVASTSHAQYYRHYYSPNSTYLWPYNYPRYQTSFSVTPYYYPGYGYIYNYPTYSYYAGPPYLAPKAYWDPYVAARPYSDNAGPKASGYGGQ
jgi:hypothetical protein